MKRSLVMLTYAAALLTAAAGCSSNDSVKQAQDANEVKADNATPSTDMGKVEKKRMEYDARFMAKAASGDMLEVEMGKQVAARATTSEAKNVPVLQMHLDMVTKMRSAVDAAK